MKNVITAILLYVISGFSGYAIAAEKPSDTVQKPTAEQILLYSEAVTKTPSVDRKVATEALQKWMDGNLTNKEAAKYNDILKLAPPPSNYLRVPKLV